MERLTQLSRQRSGVLQSVDSLIRAFAYVDRHGLIINPASLIDKDHLTNVEAIFRGHPCLVRSSSTRGRNEEARAGRDAGLRDNPTETGCPSCRFTTPVFLFLFQVVSGLRLLVRKLATPGHIFETLQLPTAAQIIGAAQQRNRYS